MADPKVKVIISYDEVGADVIEAVPGRMKEVTTRVSDTQQAVANLARGAMMAANQVNSFASGSISALAGFDQAMANTASIVQGSQEEIKRLRELAEQIGRDMPVSAQAAAEGFYMLASAGKSANEIMELGPEIMKLSIAAGTDFATTANLVTAALDSWGLSAEETGRVNDILMNTVKSFKTTLPELAVSFQYVASAAANLGVPIEETAAAIGLLRQRGLDASMAGTGLRMMLSKLAAAATATEGPMLYVRDALVQNADGSLNLTATMQNLQAVLSNVDPLERQAILTQVFGTRAAAAASILMDESASLGELSGAMTESGAVQEAYAIQAEGVANQLQVLQSEYEEQQRALAEQLLPAQIAVTRAKTEFLEALNSLPGPLGKVGGGLMMVISQLTSMAAPLFLVITGLRGLSLASIQATVSTYAHAAAQGVRTAATWLATAAQWALNAAMYATPIVWIILLIMGLIAALYLLIKHWDEVRGALEKAWDGLKRFGGWLRGVGQKALEAYRAYLERVTGAMRDLGGWIISKGRDAWDTFKAGVGQARGALENLGGWLKDKAKTSFDTFRGLLEDTLNIGRKAYEWGREMIDRFVQGIKDALGAAKDKIAGALEPVTKLFGGSPPEEGPLRMAWEKGGPAFIRAYMENLAAAVPGTVRENTYIYSPTVAPTFNISGVESGDMAERVTYEMVERTMEILREEVIR